MTQKFPFKKYLVKSFKYSLISTVCIVLFVFAANYWVGQSAEGRTFENVKNMESNRVGLVLGTAKILPNGRENLYFTYRINATVELYKAGKIQYVLISGDNGNKNYDEPTDFKEELVARGIPENRIYLDYAGFRTLDSVVRAKEIFGQTQLTFISQKFHNERALFLADAHGIDAIAYNAQDVSARYGFKTQVREYFARSKACLDIVLGVEPKFLGEKIEIGNGN
jgi:SanA protein